MGQVFASEGGTKNEIECSGSSNGTESRPTAHSRDLWKDSASTWVTQVSEIVWFVQEYSVATVDIIHSSWGNH